MIGRAEIFASEHDFRQYKYDGDIYTVNDYVDSDGVRCIAVLVNDSIDFEDCFLYDNTEEALAEFARRYPQLAEQELWHVR